MRSVLIFACAALASTLVSAREADGPAPGSASAASPTEAVCTSFREFVSSDCPLTWHGITIYGAYDVGVGWVSGQSVAANSWTLWQAAGVAAATGAWVGGSWARAARFKKKVEASAARAHHERDRIVLFPERKTGS